MQYIPPFLCQIIDLAAFGGPPEALEHAREDWSTWRQDFQQYFENERDYSLSKEDAAVVENLPHLLQELERAVERSLGSRGSTDDLVKCSVTFFEAHDSFFNEREKTYFVHSTPLDKLLKVAVAHLQGRADISAVLKRAPKAALAVDAIQELYQQTREQLPKELVEGTVEGLKRAQKGLDILAESGEELTQEKLKEAIFELRSAGELLEHIPNLFDRFQREEGSPIPIMGPLINILREEDDDDHIRVLREQAWPDFVDLWESRRDGWMLEPDVAYDLLGATEETIGQFADLVEVYPEQEDDFWDAVERLEEQFELIRENALNLEDMPSSPYWPETQLVLNLLQGSAPMYAAHTLAQGISQGHGGDLPPVIVSLGGALQEFLEQPEPLPLLIALKALRDDFELSKTTRLCACGSRIPLQAAVCSECGAKMELSVSG